MLQTTILKEVEITGVGLHTAQKVVLRLSPASDNDGITFYRSDKKERIKFCYDNVISTTLSTNIGVNNAIISTTEHLMSAIYAYGIDNINIDINADEIPIVDGSATAFCMLLNEAGIKNLSQNRKFIKITKDVEVSGKNSWVKLSPSLKSEFHYSIEFNTKAIQKQSFSFEFSKKNYLEEISKARTFGLMSEIAKMREMNLIKGGDLDNAVIFDESKVINSSKLRYENEPVRHKILDALGDLAILPHFVIGKYSSFAGSHKLNHLITKKLYEEEAFEIVDADDFKEVVCFA